MRCPNCDYPEVEISLTNALLEDKSVIVVLFICPRCSHIYVENYRGRVEWY